MLLLPPRSGPRLTRATPGPKQKMKFNQLALVLFVLGTFTSTAWASVHPDSNLTPGVLCTPKDKDFMGFAYKSKIARCSRNIKHDEKLKVAAAYKVPESEWAKYEFDHLFPLCAGGSDDPKNLWPQPLAEAHKKDVIENEVCTGLRDNTMTQAVAIQKIKDWFGLK